MLVLRRRVGERILVDGQIEVTVLAVRGGKVRLGFSAPTAVRILRAEVHSKIASADSEDGSTGSQVPVNCEITIEPEEHGIAASMPAV
jgi:carbon storage regulator